jgi:uncharacterized RDD family membrane protein YckC
LAPNGLPLADFGPRLGAYVIDRLLVGGVQLVLLLPFMIWWFVGFFEVISSQTNRAPSEDEFMRFYLTTWATVLALAAVSIVLGLGLTYLYFVEFVLRRDGQTLGKLLLKIRVMPVDPAAPLTRTDLVKRWAVESVAGAFVPVLTYIDGLWQLWDKPLRQCLHDKAAQTVVVKLG